MSFGAAATSQDRMKTEGSTVRFHSMSLATSMGAAACCSAMARVSCSCLTDALRTSCSWLSSSFLA
eukprot:7046623-Pyramimonas_sp.AAC.1